MSLQTKHMEHLFNEGYSLPDLLPYIEYKDDVFILSDGSLGKIWNIDLLEAEGKSEEALLSMAGQWENFLTRIPTDRLACQIFLISDGDNQDRTRAYLNYKENAGSAMDFAHGKVAHMQCTEKGMFTHKNECFVPKRIRMMAAVRYFPDWEQPNTFNKVMGVMRSSAGAKEQMEVQMRRHRTDFYKHIAFIEGIFQSTGVNVHVMQGDDLSAWLYRLFNPKRAKRMPSTVLNEEMPIRDQVLYHNPQADGYGFIMDGMPMRVLSLKELPASTYVGMLTREVYEGNKFCLLDIPYDFMLVINFTVPGAQETLKQLNMQKNFAFMHRHNWLGDKSIEATEKKDELDETLASMFKGAGKMVHARVHAVVRANNDDDVESACNSLLTGFNRIGCEAIKEELIGASLFLTCLPLNFDPYYERFIRRVRRLTSGNAADMLPVFGSFRGTATPAQMYCNRRGEAVFLDFFDSNINPHGVVIGASGAGKSFFINDFILQNNRLGAHFFVLDKGDSYKKLCGILDGQYMTFNLNDQVTINPFANDPTPENLSFLLSLLSQMASGGDERYRLNREEEGLLHCAVIKAYEQKKPGIEVMLSDVVNILNANEFNDQFGINSLMGPTLALRITPFTKKGPYGGFFDGPNTFTIEKHFSVFELANLSAYPDLQIVVLLNLMFFMTNFVGSAEMMGKRKFLLIDEAWSLLKVKNTADFITNAFKTFRKMRCSVVAITQELADLTRQESGIAIVANASNKIFLKQEPSIIDLLKDKLSLSEGIIKALKTVETVKGKFAEAFVITDSTCGVIRLVPDPFLYWAANSEPRNNDYLYEQARQYDGNLIEAVKVCAREHPYGI